MDFSIEQLVMVAVAFCLIVAVNGYSFALAARALGCRIPEYDGRLTLNPIRHIDLLGLAAALLTSLGWVKPNLLARGDIRYGAGGIAICVVASLLTTLVFGGLVQLLAYPAVTLLPDLYGNAAVSLLDIITRLAIWFALFNVVPIPPLGASQVLLALLPQWQSALRRYALLNGIVMLAIVATQVPNQLLLWAYVPLEALLMRHY